MKPIVRMPGEFAFAIAGAHQNAFAAGAMGQFDVTGAIADHEGSFQIQMKIPGSLEQHPGLRFAALAVVGGNMRTIIHAIKARACRGQFADQPLVNFVYQGLGKVTAADARLVGDQDNRQVRGVKTLNGRSSASQHAEAADVIQIADFFGDCTVAIDKNGGARLQKLVRQVTPPRGRATKIR